MVYKLTVSPGGCEFNCETDCFEPYHDFESASSCETVMTVLQCYHDNQQACDSERIEGGIFSTIDIFHSMATHDRETLGCGANETDDPSGDGPTPVPCPDVPEIYTVNPAIAMSGADVLPKLHPKECSMPQVTYLRQCSLFMDSQLQAFNNYRGGLETCSLPGAWFLLHHHSITVEVEGTSLDPSYNHTRLSKINVTFHTHNCNSVARTYTADNMEPLASEFTPPRSDNTTSPLQLTLGEDGTVVTLMATWLNTTIIIRQYAQFLSITLQVPGEILLESKGLCTGCPSDLYVNITAFNDRVSSSCSEDNKKSIYNCFEHAGVANTHPLTNLFNNSYLDACVFSMFKIRTPEVLSMFNAVASDAKLLMNIGDRPSPTPSTFVIDPPSSQLSRPQPSTTKAIELDLVSTSDDLDLTSTSDSSSTLHTQSSTPHAQSSTALTLVTIALSVVLSIFR